MSIVASSDILTSLTYRSRAVAPMSVAALRELERAAQAHNAAAGLTGIIVYDDGHFFQWLEGSAERLAPIWDSICRDPRHTDIHDVQIRSTPVRVFGGCDMALAIRGDAPLSKRLARMPLARSPRVERESLVVPLVPVIVEVFAIPRAFSKYGTVRRFLPPVSPVATRLARLLLADDAQPAARILRRLYARAGSLGPLCATVIEPAARNLGDLWLADDCSELAMTIALSRLHALVRRLAADAGQVALGLPAVLVAPQPGEEHILTTGLDAQLLWEAGWETHEEFPESDEALQATLANAWFDMLDLSLSPALHRPDSLPRMAATVAGARAASLNPALTVLVGGRAFFERYERTDEVGADASTMSALQVVLTATAARQATVARRGERNVLTTSS